MPVIILKKIAKTAPPTIGPIKEFSFILVFVLFCLVDLDFRREGDSQLFDFLGEFLARFALAVEHAPQVGMRDPQLFRYLAESEVDGSCRDDHCLSFPHCGFCDTLSVFAANMAAGQLAASGGQRGIR